MAAHSKSSAFIKLAVVIGLLAPLIVLAGAIGVKFGLIGWMFGFKTMAIDTASKVAMAGVALGLVALFLAFRDFRRLGVLALVALLVPLATIGGFAKLKADAAAVPPIHDVATDWEKPLGFSRQTMDARRGSPNAIEADPVVPAKAGPPWAGRRVAEINAETCPGAKPILHAVSADQVAEAFESVGVQVQGRAPWKVEGTYESFFFGFKDDIVARITPERTDFRSISRVGGSDIGANCARITKIVAALQAR